jgi:hypothetical protein
MIARQPEKIFVQYTKIAGDCQTGMTTPDRDKEDSGHMAERRL